MDHSRVPPAGGHYRKERHRPVPFFFFQAEDGIRDADVTGVQTCALPISLGSRIVFIGAASERDGAERIIRQMKRRGAINLAGETSLAELIGALDVCDLLISNDTGPAHVAA